MLARFMITSFISLRGVLLVERNKIFGGATNMEMHFQKLVEPLK